MDRYREKLIKENTLLAKKIMEIQAANQELKKKIEERLDEQNKKEEKVQQAGAFVKKKQDELKDLLSLVDWGTSSSNIKSKTNEWTKNLNF
jgi:hypothetical protein